MKALVAAVCLSIGMASAAHAQQRSTLDRLISISINPSSGYSKDERRQLVSLLVSYCVDMLNVLPTNTPSEAAWLSAEIKTTDPNKASRALASKEWARYSLNDSYTDCVKDGKELLSAQEKRGSKDISRYEAAKLVSIALTFHYDDDMQKYAKRAGLDADALKFGFITAIRRGLLIASLRALEEGQ